jgi:transposase
VNQLTKNILYKEYIENKKSIKVISNEFKIATMTIYEALLRFNIEIRKNKKYQIPRDILYIEYIENNKTLDEISKIFGCSSSTIKSQLKKYKIQLRIGKPNKNSIINEDVLYKLYIVDNLRIRDISKKFNISERYISDKLKSFNILRKRSIKNDLTIDLTGKIFGRLTVLELNDENKWICNCKCGENIILSANNLLNKNKSVKSCGCSRAKNTNWKIIPPYITNNLPKKAKSRGIEYNLTAEYLENLFIKQNKCCALSGVNLIFSRSRTKILTTASLDRIDSNIGYIEGNVQWIHKQINIAKHVISNDEFIKWCKLVAEFKKGN